MSALRYCRKYLHGPARMKARRVTRRASAKASAPAHVWSMGRRPLVLLAEDDAAMRDLIASDLRREGYEVVEAPHAEGLFAHIGRLVTVGGGAPDSIAVIISDVRMPGLSGMDVLTAVRKASSKTPVILITAFGSEEIHHQAAELGARAVLDKPFAIEELRALVRQAVNRC